MEFCERASGARMRAAAFSRRCFQPSSASLPLRSFMTASSSKPPPIAFMSRMAWSDARSSRTSSSETSPSTAAMRNMTSTIAISSASASAAGSETGVPFASSSSM